MKENIAIPRVGAWSIPESSRFSVSSFRVNVDTFVADLCQTFPGFWPGMCDQSRVLCPVIRWRWWRTMHQDAEITFSNLRWTLTLTPGQGGDIRRASVVWKLDGFSFRTNMISNERHESDRLFEHDLVPKPYQILCLLFIYSDNYTLEKHYTELTMGSFLAFLFSVIFDIISSVRLWIPDTTW